MIEDIFETVERRAVLEPTFSPDGNKIAYVTSRGKQREQTVYVSTGPNEAPTRVADAWIVDSGWHDSQRLWWVDEELVYHSYDTADRSKTRVKLHHDPEQNDHLQFLGDHSLDRSAAIVRDDRGDSLVVRRKVSDEPYEVMYHPCKYTTLFDWHPSQDLLLVRESLSTIDHRVLVVDCERGQRRTFTLNRRGARFGSLQWGPEGKYIYCVTDAGENNLYGARISLESWQLTPVVTSDQWNVDSIFVNDDGTMLYVRNKDGESVVHVRQVHGDGPGRSSKIEGLPSGVTKQGDVSPNGDRIVLAHSTEKTPSRLYVYDRRSDSLTQWRSAVESESSASDERGRTSDSVRYKSFDGREIPALLYRPHDNAESRGAIVDVHGGPERQRRPEYRPMRELFRALGFAVLEPNVRGSTGYGRWYMTLDDQGRRTAAVDDVAAASDWLRSRDGPGVDSVFVYGKSYGGFLALINSYRHSDRWDGAISVSGIYDLETFIEHQRPADRYLREQEYGPPELTEDVFVELNPLRHAEAITVPALVVHGADDRRVPPDGARSVVERASSTTARLLLYEDEGHQISQRENRVDLCDNVANFLETVITDTDSG
jgi:dipeptidyl aminopeptidase/acylaminoacyl peptidase